MTAIKKNDISERFARTFEAGRLRGAIETYEALQAQLIKMPPKSFMRIAELKATCAVAIERLKAEQSARAQERLQAEEEESIRRDRELDAIEAEKFRHGGQEDPAVP